MLTTTKRRPVVEDSREPIAARPCNLFVRPIALP